MAGNVLTEKDVIIDTLQSHQGQLNVRKCNGKKPAGNPFNNLQVFPIWHRPKRGKNDVQFNLLRQWLPAFLLVLCMSIKQKRWSGGCWLLRLDTNFTLHKKITKKTFFVLQDFHACPAQAPAGYRYITGMNTVALKSPFEFLLAKNLPLVKTTTQLGFGTSSQKTFLANHYAATI